MDNIFIRYYDMPCTIHSYVMLNRDDTYTVIINSRLSIDMQEQAMEHEMEHIQNGDYDRNCSLNLIEIHAHSV